MPNSIGIDLFELGLFVNGKGNENENDTSENKNENENNDDIDIDLGMITDNIDENKNGTEKMEIKKLGRNVNSYVEEWIIWAWNGKCYING